MMCTSHVHDLQDTCDVIAAVGSGRSKELDRYGRRYIHNARMSTLRLLEKYISHVRPRYESHPCALRAARLDETSSPNTSDLLQWALDEFGPRNLEDRAGMAQALRSCAADIQQCASLLAACRVMTRSETNACRLIGPRCCPTHDALLDVCRRLRDNTSAVHRKDISAARIAYGDSSWIIRSHNCSETGLVNARESVGLILDAAAADHISAAVVGSSKSIWDHILHDIGPEPAEHAISLHLGPSDWE